MNSSERIILLGAGNLAWHLGPALINAGYQLLQVYSRSKESSSRLGEYLGVDWTTDAGNLDPDADILVYCVPDRVIPELFCQIELSKRIMIHTAGSVPADVFKGISKDYGVLYPVMTFSREKPVDFRNIPVCIEGSSAESLAVIEKMAGRLSNRIYQMDTRQRKYLHLAGIMACNFSNHMFHLASDYLDKHSLDFNLLKPLIMETAGKIMEMEPMEAQTGPARRSDTEVIAEHIDMLKDDPGLQKLYTFVSDSISIHFTDQ